MQTLKDIELEVKTTKDIRASLNSKIQEARTQKQAEQDEWVSLESYWLKVAEKRDWENAKSNIDNASPCKMSVKERKIDAIKHFKQRALKKAKELGIEYKIEFVKSIRNGKEMHLNKKDIFVRRKHLRLFFNCDKNTTASVRNRTKESIKAFGIDNHIYNKLEIHNIRFKTFIARLHSGWSISKSATTPPKNTDTDRFLTMYPHRAWELKCPIKKTNKEILAEYEGITFYDRRATLQDLLQENGITEKQFCNRIRNGWSFANATTLDSGGYTEEARKRHNKRDIAKHVKQSRAKRYR